MRKISLAVICCIAPTLAFAEEKIDSDLVLNIRRIGLDISKTDVRNSSEYSTSPISALTTNSQDFIKGIMDVALEYKKDRLSWKNSVFTEYGKTKLKPYNALSTSTENADKILLSSDFSYAVWDYSSFKLGPTARGQYETEYTANADNPRQNLARANAGFAMFDHAIIKDLYLVGVYEYDFTYNVVNNKAAAELGWRLEYELREGVKLSTNGYYREYLTYSNYVPMDLERDLSAVFRMDVNIWGNLTMGPYVQYRLAKARAAEVYGSNTILGISFNYISKFGLR